MKKLLPSQRTFYVKSENLKNLSKEQIVLMYSELIEALGFCCGGFEVYSEKVIFFWVCKDNGVVVVADFWKAYDKKQNSIFLAIEESL